MKTCASRSRVLRDVAVMQSGPMSNRIIYASFAAFGGLWGAWGASLPAIRDQAELSPGQLGTALLFIAAGALPAMLVAGRAVDRWPGRTTAALLALLGFSGILVAVAAHGLLALMITLSLLGAASGAVGVAINTAAGSAQRARGGPVIARANAVFSVGVVAASLLAGGALAAGLPVVTPFAAVAAGTLIIGGRLLSMPDRPAEHRQTALRCVRLTPLLVIGALGALAFAVENAHQSWSAIYLNDVLGATPATAAVGPAIFAGVVALTRFLVGPLANRRPTLVLVGGALVAAVGTTLVAGASTLVVAVSGLVVAAGGTAVLFPTLLVVVTARVPDTVRGVATAAVSVVAYLGFLAGPVYVGAWAEAAGLPGAMLAVAGLAALLALLATNVRAPVRLEPEPGSTIAP